jgi:hypothetical protein
MRVDKLPHTVGLFALALVVACQSGSPRSAPPGGTGGTDETVATGGRTGTGGTTGTGGSSGTGGTMVLTLDASEPEPDGPAAGSGGTTGGTGGSGPDADTRPLADGGGGDAYPDSAFLTGRPDIRLCKKEWTMEQCCAFLCSCLNTICADSAKAKPGLASCMSWCPKISSMAARCHVYHCYISISPTGGINDHDSHCGHAANQVQGGGCPTEVYQ